MSEDKKKLFEELAKYREQRLPELQEFINQRLFQGVMDKTVGFLTDKSSTGLRLSVTAGSESYTDGKRIVIGIQTYDPQKNSKLTTYAFACGKNEVKMYLRKASAKSRTGTVISLDATIGTDPDGDTMLNRDLESMDPSTDVPTFEEQIHTRTMFQAAMSIVRNEMSHNQQIVIQRFLEGIPQSQTAKELHTSQSEISKLYKTSICELRLKMEKLGYIDRS